MANKAIAKLEPTRKEPSRLSFRLPTRIGVYGSSGSGKTCWVVDWLTTKEPWGALKQFDQVIWCSAAGSMGQAKLALVRKAWRGPDGQSFVHFVEGLDEGKLEELFKKGEEVTPKYVTLLILDDLMHLTNKSRYIQSGWTHWRHRGITMMELRQQIFSGPRTNRLQMENFVLGTNNAQKDEALRLFQQITSNKQDRDLLDLAYRRITDRDFGFLILDLKSKESEGLRARDTTLDCIIPQLANI